MSLRHQLTGVHDPERIKRLLDRAKCMNTAGLGKPCELGTLQLADAMFG